MKESLSAIPKQPIFRETFTDEQTTRLNGGVPTAVTYFNGVASFNGTSSKISYFTPSANNRGTTHGTSYRIKFKIITLATGSNKIIFDTYINDGTSPLYVALELTTTNILRDSYGFGFYVNGVFYAYNTFIASAGVWYEVVILCSANSTNNKQLFLGGQYNSVSFSNFDCELVEIYDYTLTANEVKNLYEGKRNRIIDLKQTATSIDNYYQGVGVAGNYVSTPNAAANQITGDIEIIAKIDYKNNATFQWITTKISTGTTISYSFSIDNSNSLRADFGAINVISTVSIGASYNGFVKMTRSTSSGDVKFYTSSDDITYTQLGTTRTTTAGDLTTGSGVVNLGAITGTALNFQGKIYRATIANSIGGAPVVDFNPQLYVSGTTLPSSTGETWTIVGTQGFIGNGSRPEILNIDGRNGVIANKYSNQPYSLVNLADGWNFTNWLVDGANVSINNSTTFTATGTSSGIYKGYFTVGKTYKIRIVGTTTSSLSIGTGTNTSAFTAGVTGVFDVNATYLATFGTMYFRPNTAGVTTITSISIQEIAPDIINTAVTPVRQGSVWGMDFNGSTSKLDCGNYDSLIGDISVIMWIKPKQNSGNNMLLTNGRFQLSIEHSNGRIYLTRDNASYAQTDPSTFKVGVWQQIIITSTSTGSTNFYYQGALKIANQVGGTPTVGIINFHLGTNLGISKLVINQPRIIKGILNAQEVQQLFDNERHDYGI